MSSSVVTLYEALSSAPDDQTRARLIAEAFEQLEDRFPRLPEMATQGHVRESELRLQKEIELARAEQHESELRLQKEIAQLRGDVQKEIAQLRGDVQKEITQLRGDLQKEITQLRGDLQKEIEQVRGEIARVKIDLIKWLAPLMFAQVAAIAALVKLI